MAGLRFYPAHQFCFAAAVGNPRHCRRNMAVEESSHIKNMADLIVDSGADDIVANDR